MPTIYSSDSGTTDDGWAGQQGASTWAGARDGAGSYSTTSSSASGNAVSVMRADGRRGSTTYTVFRTFLCFDTSGITGTVSAATIKIHGYSTNSASVIPVKSTAFGGDGLTGLANGDFDAITGYSAGSSLAGSATDYGPQILTSSWSTSGYNDFTGTSDLRADMQNNDVVIICLMDYTNDYLNSALASSVTLKCGAYYAEDGSAGTTRDPKIEYTVSASGYTHDVNGVAAASIGKVNYVATASIGKINSVD